VTSVFGTSPFVLAAALLGALGGIFVLAALVALKRARPLRFALRTLAGLLLLSLGGLVGAVGVGMNGYRAFTREDVAARIVVRPVGPQRFSATVLVPDRPEIVYQLAGDEIYVDAHILKWKPMANALGLHTVYELDHIAGRYDDIAQKGPGTGRCIHWPRTDRWTFSGSAGVTNSFRHCSMPSMARAPSSR
jgi:hypothetical protein